VSRYEERLAARMAGQKGADDPTWIPVHVDPRERRMRGVAAHGNTPFDVPFISNIEGNLWQGGCQNGLVLPKNIEHVVSLYPWEQYEVTHDLKSSLTVRMYDSTDQGYEQVDAIAAWVVSCLADGPTLVHCQAGLNRSSLIAGRALTVLGRTGQEAIALLREKRSPACLCNPRFEEWIADIGKDEA
jgi:protein-tyrosine phosphatase